MKLTREQRERALEAMGVTEADLSAVAATCPPLSDQQREAIAVISQPILRRLRGQAPPECAGSASGPAHDDAPAPSDTGASLYP